MYFVASAGGYSLTYFLPVILREGLGFSYAMAQVMNGIPYVSSSIGLSKTPFNKTSKLFAVVASLAMAWVSDRYRIRWA